MAADDERAKHFDHVIYRGSGIEHGFTGDPIHRVEIATDKRGVDGPEDLGHGFGTVEGHEQVALHADVHPALLSDGCHFPEALDQLVLGLCGPVVWVGKPGATRIERTGPRVSASTPELLGQPDGRGKRSHGIGSCRFVGMDQRRAVPNGLVHPKAMLRKEISDAVGSCRCGRERIIGKPGEAS